MPRYFFHIRTGDHLNRDDEGVVLPSLEAAQAEALRSAGDLIRDAQRNLKEVAEADIVVMDQGGDTLATIPIVLPHSV
jgi:hypothetical protein